MAGRKRIREAVYYEPVRKFLESEMECVTAGFNSDGTRRPFIGLGLGGMKIDVFGIRGTEERNSRSIEGIAVEVKRNRNRTSLRNIIQAHQYSRLAHRCYLAQPREFNSKDRKEAAQFGVGLLQISGNKITTISESRPFSPDTETFELFLHKSLRIVRCKLCGCHLHRFHKDSSLAQVHGYSVEDHFAPLRRGSPLNKRMYLCARCEEIMKRTDHTEELTASIKRLEKRVQNLQRGLRSK